MPRRTSALTGSGPVIIAVDNTWAAAAHWGERTRALERFIAEAEAQSRPVIIAPTAQAGKTVALKVEPPAIKRKVEPPPVKVTLRERRRMVFGGVEPREEEVSTELFGGQSEERRPRPRRSWRIWQRDAA